MARLRAAIQVTGTMAGLEWALMAISLPFYFYSSQVLSFTGMYGPQKRLHVDE